MENQSNISKNTIAFKISFVVLFVSIILIFMIISSQANSGFEGLIMLLPLFVLVMLALVSTVVIVLSKVSGVFFKIVQSVLAVIICFIFIQPFAIAFLNSGQFSGVGATIIDVCVGIVGLLALYKVWSRR